MIKISNEVVEVSNVNVSSCLHPHPLISDSYADLEEHWFSWIPGFDSTDKGDDDEDPLFRDNNIQKMSHNELTSFIQREELKGNPAVAKFKMNLYERFSLPFATYVLTLIGVSVSSRKNRGGIGVNIAIGLGFVFLYIFAMKVTSVAAINVGFPAIIAAWTPNLIFGIIGLFLYKNAQK